MSGTQKEFKETAQTFGRDINVLTKSLSTRWPCHIKCRQRKHNIFSYKKQGVPCLMLSEKRKKSCFYRTHFRDHLVDAFNEQEKERQRNIEEAIVVVSLDNIYGIYYKYDKMLQINNKK